MKNWHWHFLIISLVIGFSFSFVFSADITLTPKPKIINLKGTEATVGARSQIIIFSKIIDSKFNAAVNSFKSALTALPAYENSLPITAEIMSELYPEHKHLLYGPRGGLLDGRSDALAIAHFLREQHSSQH